MIDEIDETTRAQIEGFLNDPSFAKSYIAIMPDCHAGMGSCIGFTMQMNDRIIPDVVGVDIGCGILSQKFDIESFNIPAFDTFIKQNIPSGFAINDFDYPGHDFFSTTAKKIGVDQGRASRSIGTLGGGNHFIEAGFGSDGKLWVSIHSGSRNFGLQIAKYHGNIARFLSKKIKDEQGIPFLFVDSPEGQAYIADQRIGTKYASLNRVVMMKKIESFFSSDSIESGDSMESPDSVESVHNFIDDSLMIRKGATPAHKGQRLIIPFNMRDGIAICIGKGNKAYNYSAPHGAGRILSRTKAKATLNLASFQKQMKNAGVYTTTANTKTLDEAPGAYKDTNLILENIKETVDVLEIIKPVYNFKAN